MSKESIRLVTNIFEILGVDKLLEMPVTGYRVLASTQQDNLHGLASYISGLIRKRYRVFAFPYVHNDNDYVIVVGDVNVEDIEDNIRDRYWSIIRDKEITGFVKDMGSNLIIRLLYELFNYALVYNYGYYRVRKSFINTNYTKKKGKLWEYRLYEGFFIKIFGDSETGFYIALDPTRTLTYDKPLIDFIKQGDIKRWKRRGMLGVYTRFDDVTVIRYGVLKKIDTSLNISSYPIKTPPHAIRACGDNVSLKEYYTCVLGANETACMEDDEPVVFLGNLPYPPRILYPIVRTEDLRDESKEIKKVYFLSPKERMAHTKKARDLLASIKEFNLPEIKLSEEPLAFNLKTLKHPTLLVGKGKEVEPNISDNREYRETILEKLRKYGPYSRSLRSGEILFLYKRRHGVSEQMLYNLYQDLRETASKDFKIDLPSEPIIKLLYMSELERTLKHYKDNIALVFVMLKGEQDEDYFTLKNTFNKFNVPSQMLTPKIISYYYSQHTNKKEKGKYINTKRNLIIGALGKAGIIPWILKGKLKADLYVGYDIGHEPSREHPCVATFVFIDNRGAFVSTGYIKLGQQRKLKLDQARYLSLENYFRHAISEIENKGEKVKNIVIHKDGDIYYDDIMTFKLLAKRLNLNMALVSIKKSKGYRIYRKKNDSIEASYTGDYVILSKNKALIVTMGYGFIRQGTPVPLLIELRHVDSEFNYTIQDALDEVYKLSYIHWQVVTSKIKLPATIAYADEWAYLGVREVEATDMPPL